MSESDSREAKGDLRNFRFVKSADDELSRQSDKTGRTMTAIIEDYLLNRREFPEHLQLWLDHESARTKLSQREILHCALLYYASNGTAPAASPVSSSRLSKTEQIAVASAVSAIRLALKSSLKQTTAAPSGDKPGPSGGAGGHPKK